MNLQKAIWLSLAAILLAVSAISCTSTSQDKSSNAAAKTGSRKMPAPTTGRPVILTSIATKAGSCDAEFVNNNCGGEGVAGSICVKPSVSESKPTKVFLNFVITGPGAAATDFESMDITLQGGGGCPADVQTDFPDFDASCKYTASTGNSMQVKDNNVITRDWDYSITLKRSGCPSQTLHPPISNGGGNSSSGDP